MDSRYKRKSLKFACEQYSRSSRHAEAFKARESSRFKRLSVIRSYDDDDYDFSEDIQKSQEQSPKDDPKVNLPLRVLKPPSVKVSGTTPKPASKQIKDQQQLSNQTRELKRVEMLKKWKEEKSIKQELEKQKKKQPFYSACTKPFSTLKVPSDTKSNFSTSFLRQRNETMNVSNLSRSRNIAPPSQIAKTLSNSKKVAPPPRSIPKVPPKVPYNFKGAAVAAHASKVASSTNRPGPNSLKKFVPKETNSASKPTIPKPSGFLRKDNKSLLKKPAIKITLPEKNQTNASKSTNLTAVGNKSATGKKQISYIKPPSKESEKPGTSIPKFVSSKTLSKPPQKIPTPNQMVKPNSFKAPATLSFRKATPKAAPSTIANNEGSKDETTKSVSNSQVGTKSESQNEEKLNQMEVSFAPVGFKFNPCSFLEDDILGTINEAEMEFLKRTSTPSKSGSRDFSLIFKQAEKPARESCLLGNSSEVRKEHNDEHKEHNGEHNEEHKENNGEHKEHNDVSENIMMENDLVKLNEIYEEELLKLESSDILISDDVFNDTSNEFYRNMTNETFPEKQGVVNIKNRITENISEQQDIILDKQDIENKENSVSESEKVIGNEDVKIYLETEKSKLPEIENADKTFTSENLLSYPEEEVVVHFDCQKKSSEMNETFNASEEISKNNICELIKSETSISTKHLCENLNQQIEPLPLSIEGVEPVKNIQTQESLNVKETVCASSDVFDVNVILKEIEIQQTQMKLKDDEDNSGLSVIDSYGSPSSERKSTAEITKNSILKCVSMLNSIPEESSIAESVKKSSKKSTNYVGFTARRSTRLLSSISQQDENSSEESSILPDLMVETPRRSARLRNSFTSEAATPRRSMRLIDLNTPPSESKSSVGKSNITADFARMRLSEENKDPSLFLDFEDSPCPASRSKPGKVSLLYSPDRRRSLRKSIRGDLMTFSPKN